MGLVSRSASVGLISQQHGTNREVSHNTNFVIVPGFDGPVDLCCTHCSETGLFLQVVRHHFGPDGDS